MNSKTASQLKTNSEITIERLDKYLVLTKKAIDIIESTKAIDNSTLERELQAKDFLDMAKNYYSDSLHFKNSEDLVNAFAAINYAHAWLDAGARLKLFKVKDSHLFAAD